MREKALDALMISTTQAGFALLGMTVNVRKGNQPTSQGTPSADTITLYDNGSKRYGFPKETDTFDTMTELMIHTTTTVYETTYQFAAQVIQNPVDTAQVTANDYMQMITSFFQNIITVQALNAVSVGILRIPAIRKTYYKNDRGQFDTSSIVEMTVTHTDVLTQTVGSTTTINSSISNVTE